MRLLSIEPTLKTPGVILSDGALLFQGTSIIESADSFFEPIFSWINEYLENPSPLTAITIRLQYIDTASVKNISKMLVALVELKKRA